jgi:prepilin-type N-terminal cleavage/methylation domain-containing protein
MNRIASLASLRRTTRGFTLVELAIVLGVVAVLTAGAWKLLSSGNQQVKDQTTAQQHAAMIDAVKNYLADTSSTGGQVWLKSLAANATANLPLPTSNNSVSDCQSHLTGTTYDSLCNYLPTGITSTSVNPYSQTYNIRVLKDDAAAGTAPASYSFMIISVGGRAIPDVNGGRISQFIGADGGFIYTSSTICGTASPAACGALGSWKIADITDAGSASPPGYGYAAANVTAGHVASRTYVSGGVASNYFWLARVDLPGDTSHVYNTMATNLYLGTTASGTPNTFEIGNGYISGNGGKTGAQIDLTSDGTTSIQTLISLSTGCSALGTPSTCAAATTRAIAATGDVGIAGQITATKIYSSSDARLKTNIRPIHEALSNVMKIDPVSFSFKAGGSKSMGVTAQNLEKVYPELVTETDGKKFVDYNGLSGPLLAAIQELKRENDALRAQLHEQSERQDRLERMIGKKPAY